MKKLVLSAMLVVAFSAGAMAKTKNVKRISNSKQKTGTKVVTSCSDYAAGRCAIYEYKHGCFHSSGAYNAVYDASFHDCQLALM